MLYISTKFFEIIMNGIKVIERTRFLVTKGNNSAKKMQVEQLLLISARRLVIFHICAKCREIISNGIKVTERTRFPY